MSTTADQRRLLLERAAIEELKEMIARDAYMSVEEVRTKLGLSREKLEAIPLEVLPFTDFGLGDRSLKRYHPADVLAVDARMRAWQAAQARGAGEAYLSDLRAQLEARDAAAQQVAREMGEALRVA